MPRDLSDVLHHFLPELDDSRREPPAQGPAPALPLLSIPIGDRDVVRGALAWNLAVEVARLGASASVIAPQTSGKTAIWPTADLLGCEALCVDAPDLAKLHREAQGVAERRAADAPRGGVVIVYVPPEWLRSDDASQLDWLLLFTSSDPADLRETYALAELAHGANPSARIGVSVHGARRVAEAERTFLGLASAVERRLGRELTSYGLLVDDLHVYRAIVSQRPIGLAYPQSPAARALRDVARLLLEDARAGVA